MQVHIGTSGWIYKDWAKRFYPDGLRNDEKLIYFSQHYNTVEINNTFYRLPSIPAVKGWFERTPANFTFSVKLSRYLTHICSLKPGEDLNQGLMNYFDRTKHLGRKIGSVLVQLPPSFKAQPDRLWNLDEQIKDIEKRCNLKLPLAFEFRHTSWFEPEILKEMKKRNLCAVVASGPNWPETREITADFAVIRFHGDKKLYASSYTKTELDKWANYINDNCQSCKKVFCYFNNDQSAKAIQNADYLAARLGVGL